MFGMGTGVTLAVKPPTNLQGDKGTRGLGVWRVCCSQSPGHRVTVSRKKMGWERLSESCAVLLHEEWHKVFWTSQATRAISTARLSILLCLHLQPINVLVSNGPSGSLRSGKIRLEGGFPLRCFQRFSGPDIATRRCHWHDSRYTRGQSVPVLSY